ncbi:3-hydroxybutyryl-CoA dehydrogenase [Paenibacillus koleovorans]|uniref:3-hydroxybutyryl-CoA dehydrogenase n=1 Tax=Paenibacillus koleovorans TaxID=121608 RepID=UPI000FDA9F16|nr:3-hydroxybutyryl-CoA dehydrogenase [Paenibacillus koleovorans]
MDIRTILVIGAGQMGSGIAQTAAQRGLTVLLHDREPQAVRHGLSVIQAALERSMQKGKITEADQAAALSRIQVLEQLEPDSCAAAEVAIEAAAENVAVKAAIFRELERVCRPVAILATNTSSLPITEIAAATSTPHRVIGMHFMNPVPVMPLVEVIRGAATSDEVCEMVMELAERMGKTPVEVNDFPGFVANRILMPMINEAIFAVYEGVAKPEAVDQVMKLGMNHPMGPLALADLIGLDTCLAIMETLYAGFGDSKYRPCPLLRKYVAAGWLGRKSGKGFYTYAVQP